MPGLLMVKSNEQMNAEQAEERDNLASDLPEPITGQLVGKINAAWSRNKRHKGNHRPPPTSASRRSRAISSVASTIAPRSAPRA